MRLNRIILSVLILSFFSCVSDKEEGVLISDATIYSLVNSSSYSYFKNSFDTLVTDNASPHGNFIRVRFNPKAQSAMNDSLSGLNNSSFPDESLVVKEIYGSKGGPLVNYAVMYKLRSASNESSGWIWSELDPAGNVIYSAARKGDQCNFCHSDGRNADLIRTFNLH